jgi:membrane protein
MASPQTSAAKKSLWMLGGLTLWKLIRNVFEETRANNSLGWASELAFDFLFALFPTILLMLTLFGLFASRSSELQSDFVSYFADFLPPTAFQLLRETASELTASASGGKLTLGLVFALWFASRGVSSMISALNSAYRVREVRSWLKVRAIALGLTLLISILLFAALFLVLVTSHFVDWLGAVFRLQPIAVLIWKIIQWPAAILFVILSYAVIYYCGPNLKDRHWHWITPGSAFGASLWLLASIGFRMYLHFFDTYSASYGALGAVMILLGWLYVTGLAFLIGASMNAEIERAAAERLLSSPYGASGWGAHHWFALVGRR